jgi:hypothetical protein
MTGRTFCTGAFSYKQIAADNAAIVTQTVLQSWAGA